MKRVRQLMMMSDLQRRGARPGAAGPAERAAEVLHLQRFWIKTGRGGAVPAAAERDQQRSGPRRRVAHGGALIPVQHEHGAVNEVQHLQRRSRVVHGGSP